MPPDVRDDDFDNDELPDNEERTTVGPMPTAEDVAPRPSRRAATPLAADDADSVTTNDEPRSPQKRAPAATGTPRAQPGSKPDVASSSQGAASGSQALGSGRSRAASNTPSSSLPAPRPAAQTAKPATKPAQHVAARPAAKGWADQAVRSSTVRDRKETPRDEVRRNERPARDAQDEARPTKRVDRDEVDAYASAAVDAAVDSEKTPPPEPKREARPVRRAEPTVTKSPPQRETRDEHTDAESDPWRGDDQEVLGAPERTIVAPLPPQEESVEPVPAARPVRKKKSSTSDDKARARLSAPIDLDEHEPASRTARRKTTVEGGELPDNAWSRFKVAVVDLWRVIVLSVKTNWKILRTQGPKPFIERARPHVLRWWAKLKEWALIAWSYIRRWFFQARKAVTSRAEKLGWIKPQPRYEFEAETKDTADRARAEEWKKFQKGKTSSSYLQDDE